VRKCWLDLEL